MYRSIAETIEVCSVNFIIFYQSVKHNTATPPQRSTTMAEGIQSKTSVSTTRSQRDSSDEEDSDDEFETQYKGCIESIRSPTGLEIGIAVNWPGVGRCWELSTCLSQECLAPLFHGTQWAGTRIWRASMVALEYLLSMDNVPNHGGLALTRNSTVLELGCGLGLPGMVLHALRDCRVILTDKSDLIATLQENLTQSFPLRGKDVSRINAQPLDWSQQGARELLQDTGLTFDLVLNCDCIFEPLYGDSWKYLLECQAALLEANPSSYLLTSVERRKFDGIQKYLEALQNAGIVAEQVRPSFTYPPQVQLYRLFPARNSADSEPPST